MQRRSINRRRGLLLLRIETLDSAASTFNFNTFGIKKIIGQGGQGHAPLPDNDSDHAECPVRLQSERVMRMVNASFP